MKNRYQRYLNGSKHGKRVPTKVGDEPLVEKKPSDVTTSNTQTKRGEEMNELKSLLKDFQLRKRAARKESAFAAKHKLGTSEFWRGYIEATQLAINQLKESIGE
jgi:hypothetical protein